MRLPGRDGAPAPSFVDVTQLELRSPSGFPHEKSDTQKFPVEFHKQEKKFKSLQGLEENKMHFREIFMLQSAECLSVN